jgi:hypothetical protein
MVKLKSTLSGKKKPSLFERKDWMIFRDVKHSVSLFRKLKMIYCCANCVLNLLKQSINQKPFFKKFKITIKNASTFAKKKKMKN